jgi:DNA-binding transcriptional LysR family regulator
VDVRRLRVLLELSRRGSMRAVGEALGISTSTVSQQIAALAREVGTPLVRPEGRRVRLTPAGQRLAGHAIAILAAVDAARLDLDATADPAGVVRVAGFASAIRRSLMPMVADLAVSHPRVQLRISEHEPAEALELLSADEVDLALTFDYNLAPAGADPTLESTFLWETPWGLGIPSAKARAATLEAFSDDAWIVDSRSSADEQALRTIASMRGFEPRVLHRVDSLDLVQDMIAAGLGIALLPAARPTRSGVRLVPLTNPPVTLRCYAVTRRGQAGWPPLALVLGLLGSGDDAASPQFPAADRSR